jgi:hypothetical protein
MLHYLKISEKPNKKEAGGVLKWFVTLKPSCSLDQMNCALEVVRWISRHHLFEEFVDFFEVVKPHINLTLLKCYENARKQNMKIMDFINLYHDEVLLLRPDAALAKIIGHTGEWLEVETELQELVSSSELGLAIFGFAIKKTLAEVVAKTIWSEEVMRFRKALHVELNTIHNINALPERRAIEVIEYIASLAIDAWSEYGGMGHVDKW